MARVSPLLFQVLAPTVFRITNGGPSIYHTSKKKIYFVRELVYTHVRAWAVPCRDTLITAAPAEGSWLPEAPARSQPPYDLG